MITSPIPGSTLTSSSATFVWTAGAGATNYWLDVGSTPGGNQYEQSGALGNVTDADGERTADGWQHDLRHAVLAGWRRVVGQRLHLHGVQCIGRDRGHADANSGIDAEREPGDVHLECG